jgi:hypothetical protein
MLDGRDGGAGPWSLEPAPRVEAGAKPCQPTHARHSAAGWPSVADELPAFQVALPLGLDDIEEETGVGHGWILNASCVSTMVNIVFRRYTVKP